MILVDRMMGAGSCGRLCGRFVGTAVPVLASGLGDCPDAAPGVGWASGSIPLMITEVCLQRPKKYSWSNRNY